MRLARYIGLFGLALTCGGVGVGIYFRDYSISVGKKIVSSSAPVDTHASLASDLEKLQINAAASLLLCEMTAKTEFLSLQIGDDDLEKVEAARWKCARDSKADLAPFVSKAKDGLADKTTATALLKGWYALWLTLIENEPRDGSSPNTTALDESFKKIIVETTW